MASNPTPQDVQAKLDAAVTALSATTSSYTNMAKKYGNDWTKWPATTKWFIALSAINAARSEAGQLLAPGAPVANFAYKER